MNPPTGKSIKRSAILLLLALVLPHPTASVDIPINAVILNSPPRLLGVSIDQQVDPCTAFDLRLVVSDNNTLADISMIRVLLSPARGPQTLSLQWRKGEGFTRREGGLRILSFQQPDMNAASGAWTLSLEMPSNSSYGPWQARVIVADEQNSSESALPFWVNSYISVSLASHTPIDVMLASRPGSTARAVVDLTYSANQPVDLLASCTSFRGVSDPSYQIPADSFRVTFQQRRITLSEEEALVASGLPSSQNGTIRLVVETDIPSPFLDQEYRGTISLTLRPG